jgi:DNA-binding IclR family transcriptional regulator
MMNTPPSKPSGTQSVGRAVSLLKLVSKYHRQGSDLKLLVQLSGLERVTAYRLLQSLVESGLVERDPLSKKYHLSIGSLQLGLDAMTRSPLIHQCRPVMQQLARLTDDSVYLAVRNGDHGQCLYIESGAHPLKTSVLEGGFLLLGLGTAGRAIMATLSDEEIQVLYHRHQSQYDAYGLTLPRLQQLLQQVRLQGYSDVDDLVTQGVGGVGVAFRIAYGGYAAISVGATKTRMNQSRKKWIAELIDERIGQIAFLSGVNDA